MTFPGGFEVVSFYFIFLGYHYQRKRYDIGKTLFINQFHISSLSTRRENKQS